jgi:protein-S-isoprenylcysteine O-methyltransferase Ste14
MKRRITPDGLFISLVVLSLLFHKTIPLGRVLPSPWNLSGIILILIGIIMTTISNLTLLKNKTSIQPYETPQLLITTGLFKLSRNPIYLGMVIVLVGVVMILGSLSPIISPIIFVIIMNNLIIPTEENNLEMVFGDKYLDYKTKTRRWI